MIVKFVYSFIWIILLPLLESCSLISVITATNHSPGIQTEESISKFVKKHGISGFQVLRYDTSFHDYGRFSIRIAVFNSSGKFLSLHNNDLNCSDNNYDYYAMKYILDHGDSSFIVDSLEDSYYTIRDTKIESNILEEIKDGKNISLDTSIFELHRVKSSINLDIYNPNFRNLNGDKVNIYSLFTDYIVMFEFIVSGKSNITALKIKRIIKDINKLKKNYKNRIEFVLVNGDLIE